MADLSGISNVVFIWVKSGIFWLVLSLIFTVGCVVILYWRKHSKLKYNCIEIISFGNGKIGLNNLKGGIFKSRSAIGGLWDYGNESIYKVSDGRRILEASEDDLHDIRGKKGFLLRRKDGDPKILVPISKVCWKNEESLFEIAPADFRDASVSIINEAHRETQGWADKYLPYIMLGGIVVFFIISMILASQFFNRTVDKAGQILLQAGNVAPGVSP